MTDRDPAELKTLLLFLLLIGLWGGCGYALFVGAICVWVGIDHFQETGAWVPIVAGGLTIAAVLRLALPLGRLIRGAIRGKGAEADLGPFLDGN